MSDPAGDLPERMETLLSNSMLLGALKFFQGIRKASVSIHQCLLVLLTLGDIFDDADCELELPSRVQNDRIAHLCREACSVFPDKDGLDVSDRLRFRKIVK